VTRRKPFSGVEQAPRSRQTPAVSIDPFTFRWWVDSAGHEWKKGAASPKDLLLVARNVPGSPLKLYYPLEKYPGLFRDFSVLRGKDDILQFANLYGTLFHGGYSSKGRAQGGTLGKDPIGKLFGTSLAQWEWEIADMRILVHLWESIVDRNVKELAHIVTWERDGSVGYKIDAPRRKPNVWLWVPSFGSPLPDVFKPGDILLPARYALQAEINARLANPEIGLSVPCLNWTPDLKQRITITPPNLLAGMWLQFAQTVTGNYLLKRCQGCGNYFQAGPGGKRSDAETCGSTCRQRKARMGGTKTRVKN
jgi:hypothetical protein